MSVIRMIKLFGWEKQMEGRIADTRDGEALVTSHLSPSLTGLLAELKAQWQANIIDSICIYTT